MKKIEIQGFTIVELMIATAIFSTILLICTTAMIQVGRYYYKGVNSARTQESARNIIEQISLPVQLSGYEPYPIPFNTNNYNGLDVYAFCIGNDRYNFAIDVQVTDGLPDSTYNPARQSPHALWKDKTTDPSCPTADLTLNKPSSDAATGKELLNSGMRIKALSVAPVVGNPSLWSVDVSLLYGDSDLIDPATGNCISSSIGGSFCGVSDLHTTVYRRVQ